MTDVIKRITELMEDRHMTTYQLAKKSGLSSSTITNMFRRGTIPSIITLESICEAFGITLSQFFYEDIDAVPLSFEQKEFFRKWSTLTIEQKEILNKLINEFK